MKINKKLESLVLKYGWFFRAEADRRSVVERLVIRRIEKRRIARENNWLKSKGWHNYLSFWYGPVRPWQPYFKYEALLLTCYKDEGE